MSTQVKENINEFIEAHNLILLMFNLSPEVLLSVIPQLQEELTVSLSYMNTVLLYKKIVFILIINYHYQ